MLFRSSCGLLLISRILGAGIADFQFPLPVDLNLCISPIEAHSSRSTSGGIFVYSERGEVLDVKCIHDIIPELDSVRTAAQRFSLQGKSFRSAGSRGSKSSKSGGRLGGSDNRVYGSIGTIVLQSAFSRTDVSTEYSRLQYLLQQWLKDRCNRYLEAALISDCKEAYMSFSYQSPVLSPAEAQEWRANVVEWLELDEDADVFEDPEFEQEEQLGNEDISESDLAFMEYLTEHPEAWKDDPFGMMEQFYTEEEVQLVRRDIELLEESTVSTLHGAVEKIGEKETATSNGDRDEH